VLKKSASRASAFSLQSWKTVKKPKEFLTTKDTPNADSSFLYAPLRLVFSSKTV
jgi:hypothetical protein